MSDIRRPKIRQRLFALLIAGLGGLVASAISFSIAIYKTAHPPEVPAVSAGQEINTGRWLVTLHSARTGTVPPTGIVPAEPRRLVMVDMDVMNRSAIPTNVVTRAVMLSTPEDDLPEPTVYLDRDKYLAGYFNPGMPERVTMAWEWPTGLPLPDRLILNVNGQIYKLRDNLYGASGWFDRDPVATVELPVEKTP